MVTYTKRAYLADVARVEAAAAAASAAMDALHDRCAAEGVSDEITAEFNRLNDAEWEARQERREIEGRWMRRRWTGADYASAELVSANVD